MYALLFFQDSTNICRAPAMCSPLWEVQEFFMSLAMCRDLSQILKKDFYPENGTSQVLFFIRSMKPINLFLKIGNYLPRSMFCISCIAIYSRLGLFWLPCHTLSSYKNSRMYIVHTKHTINIEEYKLPKKTFLAPQSIHPRDNHYFHFSYVYLLPVWLFSRHM